MQFSRKALAYRGNGTQRVSSPSYHQPGAQRQWVAVGKEEGRSGVQFSRKALAYRGNGTQRVSSPSYHQPGAQRQWVAVGKEEGRSGVQFSREAFSLPWKRNVASFFYPPYHQLRAQRSGSELERKKEGAECSFHGKAKPARGNGTARVSSDVRAAYRCRPGCRRQHRAHGR